MKTLRFGFSPCPNDTIQFYALIHGRIDTGGITFEPVIADVEELNLLALDGALEMTKASSGCLMRLIPRYLCLKTGGALGRGAGPLWVAKEPLEAGEAAKTPIAHPGMNTTAHLLLKLRLGGRLTGLPMIFHEIMDAVAKGRARSGVIIHEGRFTYARQGLNLIEDLGIWWERETGLPVPLGNILLRRDAPIPPSEAGRLLKESLLYARSHEKEVMAWVKSLAREMEDEVIARHIALYVNENSLDLGDEGQAALRELLRRQARVEGIPFPEDGIFQ